MPKFLNRSQIYRILQRELPEDVYPDGTPSAYFHTADMDSIGGVVESSYDNLSEVYNRLFPQSSDLEGILQWEIDYFGNNLPEPAQLIDRINRVLQKIRAPRGISRPRLEAIVRQVLGDNVLFEIINSGCGGDRGFSWVLNESMLGVTTALRWLSGLEYFGANNPNCDYRTSPPPGIDMATWLAHREEVYTYYVRIFDRVLTLAEFTALDIALNNGEPGRSRHVIDDGLDPADAVTDIISNQPYIDQDGDNYENEDGEDYISGGG